MKLHEEILQLLKDQARYRPNEYINPNFLMEVSEALFDFYGIEDDEVDDWVQDMWGM